MSTFNRKSLRSVRFLIGSKKLDILHMHTINKWISYTTFPYDAAEHVTSAICLSVYLSVWLTYMRSMSGVALHV